MDFQKFLKEKDEKLSSEWKYIEKITGCEFSQYIKNVSPRIGVERLVMKINAETRNTNVPNWEMFIKICSCFPDLYTHYCILQDLENYNPVPPEIDLEIRQKQIERHSC